MPLVKIRTPDERTTHRDDKRVPLVRYIKPREPSAPPPEPEPESDDD